MRKSHAMQPLVPPYLNEAQLTLNSVVDLTCHGEVVDCGVLWSPLLVNRAMVKIPYNGVL